MKHPNFQPSNHSKTVLADGAVVSCASGDVIMGEKLRQLEELDDTLFAAIDGDPDALNRAQRLLLAAEVALDESLVAESRRQYARRAESIWQLHQRASNQSLPRVFAALEILELVSE